MKSKSFVDIFRADRFSLQNCEEGCKSFTVCNHDEGLMNFYAISVKKC